MIPKEHIVSPNRKKVEQWIVSVGKHSKFQPDESRAIDSKFQPCSDTEEKDSKSELAESRAVDSKLEH